MSATPSLDPATEPSESLPSSRPQTDSALLSTLRNPLILFGTVPYLPVSALLSLSAASRAFRHLVLDTPGVWRHLDLTRVRAAQFNDIDGVDHGGQVWRNVQMDENLTEDEYVAPSDAHPPARPPSPHPVASWKLTPSHRNSFYSGPLRGIFSALNRRSLLGSVQTLILDGLSVPSDLCYDIINDPSFNVRILSLRDVKNLNVHKLCSALRYAARPSRPNQSTAATSLKALYVFGTKDPAGNAKPKPTFSPWATSGTLVSAAVTLKSSELLSTEWKREGDAWWERKGRIIGRRVEDDWVATLIGCEGLIAFDAVLCRGPHHRTSPASGKIAHWNEHRVDAVATVAVPACGGCGSAPEGIVTTSCQPVNLPLLSPPPIMASSLRAATTPKVATQSFVPRCVDCLRERYCSHCHRWWCETCYAIPDSSASTAGAGFDVDTGLVAGVVIGPDGSVQMAKHGDANRVKAMKPKVRSGYCIVCRP